MAEEINVKDIAQGVEEIRKSLETVSEGQRSFEQKFERLDGVEKEKVEKVEKALEKLDEANNKLVLKEKQEENEKKELEERLGNFESQLIKSTKSTEVNYKETAEYKAFNALVKIKGMNVGEIAEEHKSYLRTDVGSQGGYLVPEVLASEILREIEEISPVRALARVRNMPGVKTLNIPIRVSLPTATFEGENESVTSTDSDYASETMTAHRQTIVTTSTRDLLNFAGFDMQSEISSDAMTAFAQGEGNRFVLGNATKQPQGILDSTTGISQINGSGSSTITMDDVINLSGELKIGYNPVYAFNRKTLTLLRTEKDSNGNYLWRAGGESQPTTINGFNYVLLQDMPDIATDSLSVIFGDFFRGYNILDSVNTELIRDDYTLASKAAVKFNWHRWLDGRVVLSEAFKILKAVA